MIIHIGTQIQTVLGRLDDQGNLVEQFALSPGQGRPVQVFSADAFAAAFAELAKAREELAARQPATPQE